MISIPKIWLLVGLAVLLVVLSTLVTHFYGAQLLRLDYSLTEWLNNCHDKVADEFFYRYSAFGTWVPTMLVLGFCFYHATEGSAKQRVPYLLVMVLLFVILDQLSSSVIKPWVCRLRPSHDPQIDHLLEYVNNYRGGRYGFVSGHATNGAGLTTWLWLHYHNRWLRAVTLLHFILLAFSRIYLGVHFLGDVMGGIFLGVTVTLVYYHLVKRWFSFDKTQNPIPLHSMVAATWMGLLFWALFKAI